MASQIRRIIQNTRERALSTDFNDSTNLIHRAMLELLASTAGRQAGVVHGLVVSVAGVGLDCTVSSGLAIYNSGGATSDDSDFDWIELETGTTVTLPAADGANPRWDVIEIAANDAVELSALRDIFNPALGTFTSQTVEKRRASEPTITVRSGTAAASPEFPAGQTGTIPLAYVYVPAAAGTLTVGDEVLCRPIAIPVVDPMQGLAAVTDGSEFRQLRGGGVRKDEIGTAGGANDLSLVTKKLSGYFPGARSPFMLPDGGAYTLAYGRDTDGMAAAPGANDTFYLYAIDANEAYPTGNVSTLAPREFVPGANIVTAARFGTGALAAGQVGCLLVGSLTAPADARDPVGAPAAGSPSSLSMVGFGTVNVNRSGWVYVGSIHYRDDIFNGISTVATDELAGQETVGSRVIPQFVTGDEVTATGDVSLWIADTGITTLGTGYQDDAEFPITALIVEGRVRIDLDNNGSSALVIQIDDEATGTVNWRWDILGSATSAQRYDFPVLFHLDAADGHVNVAAFTAGVSGDDAFLTAHAYIDSVLAARGM